jgi:hypothetical protein
VDLDADGDAGIRLAEGVEHLGKRLRDFLLVNAHRELLGADHRYRDQAHKTYESELSERTIHTPSSCGSCPGFPVATQISKLRTTKSIVHVHCNANY